MPSEEAAKAIELTHESTKQLLAALKYIPDDKLDWVPMGKAKTPLAIAAECAIAHKWLAAELRGEENAGAIWEGTDLSSFATREAVQALVDEALADLGATLQAMTEEQLAEKRQMFWGEEMTLGGLMWMAKSHTDYHTGQLNYIQTLLGDTDYHMD